MLSTMEGRPKRQSAVDKDYRERKRIRKEKEGDLGDDQQDVVQAQCRQLYRRIKDFRDPDDPEYFLSTLFAQLPSKRLYPDYYDVIKNPIALSNMKTKIDQQEYTSVADLKADIELMVANAKKYNIKESQVYQDAIKIHKYVKHWRPDDERGESSSKKSNSKEKSSTSPSDTKGKTVLKLPGGAFGNNAARNNPPQQHQVKAIRLKAVDKQSKKRTVTLKELMDAIAQSDTKKTLELLEADPTINVNELLEVEMFGDTFKWGPLHSACYYGDVKVCQALIAMGANVELHDTWYSATPLSWAAFGDKDKVARLLVEKYNANRKAKNIHKQVPFDVVTDKDDPRWIGIFKGPYTPKQDKKSPDAKPEDHSQRTKESESPVATESPQPAKKRRGRPPKAEKESLDAQNRPVEEVDLQDFDPVAYMKDIFHQLRVHTDNAGRLYSEIFEDLPDRKEYPDYYNVITKPRSLSIIEDNMVNRRYPTLGAWFDDIKLVFENAKEYNEPGSRVHRDAKLLMRLLIRLKERNLSRFGVPESQEKDVMRMTLSNRSYDTDDKRRPKRATSSKPRAMTEDSTTTSTPESGVITNGATRSIISRPFMNAPNVVNILGAISTNSAQPTFPTPEFVAAASAEMLAATNDQLMLNGQRPAHLSEESGVQVPVASPAFFDLFNVDVRDLRPLKSIQLESSDKSFTLALDGEVVGHSFTVPSKVDVMTIKPVLDQVLASEHKRVSVAVLQNNGRLNMAQGSLDATGDPPCWQSAPLMRGLNTIKITVTANVTKASGSMPEYRTQIYFLFITQTW